jgi:hypothetical protein
MFRLRTSQHIIVLSCEPDTATVDSSLYRTQVTRAACPRSLRNGVPELTSHSITDLSCPHDTIWLPYQMNDMSNNNLPGILLLPYIITTFSEMGKQVIILMQDTIKIKYW